MLCAVIWSVTGSTSAVADDGDEALRLLDTEQIDLAVLDVMMPGRDGLALCRTLRRGDGYAIPVILLTALGEEDDRIAGLKAGADDYVTKPFSPRELALRDPLAAAPRARAGAAIGHQRRCAGLVNGLALGACRGSASGIDQS